MGRLMYIVPCKYHTPELDLSMQILKKLGAQTNLQIPPKSMKKRPDVKTWVILDQNKSLSEIWSHSSQPIAYRKPARRTCVPLCPMAEILLHCYTVRKQKRQHSLVPSRWIRCLLWDSQEYTLKNPSSDCQLEMSECYAFSFWNRIPASDLYFPECRPMMPIINIMMDWKFGR